MGNPNLKKTNEKIKSYLNALSPTEMQIVQDHLSSMQGTQVAQWEELAESLQQKEIPSWVLYIDSLYEKYDLRWASFRQLEMIKYFYKIYALNMDLTKKLSIDKNNHVCIDGCILPKGVRPTLDHERIKSDPELFTYPHYTKKILNFVAELTGTTFTFPGSRDNLQKGEIDWDKFLYDINYNLTNETLLKVLSTIMWFNGKIPVGVDKGGYVIYAVISSEWYYYFYRDYRDVRDCITFTKKQSSKSS